MVYENHLERTLECSRQPRQVGEDEYVFLVPIWIPSGVWAAGGVRKDRKKHRCNPSWGGKSKAFQNNVGDETEIEKGESKAFQADVGNAEPKTGGMAETLENDLPIERLPYHNFPPPEARLLSAFSLALKTLHPDCKPVWNKQSLDPLCKWESDRGLWRL